MRVKFYLTSSGRSPVEEFMKDQALEVRTAFVDAVNLLAGGQMLSMPVSRNLSGIYPGFHELRIKDRSGQMRIFYYIKRGDAIYMLHAFKKKSQGLPKKELEVALKRLREV